MDLKTYKLLLSQVHTIKEVLDQGKFVEYE